MTALTIIDWLLVLTLLLPVLYLFLFAAFSMRRRTDDYPPARKQRRFVTLIPAYKADAVILRTAQAALAQEYPEGLHRVTVIADRLKPETLAGLRRLPLTVIVVMFENSSKAKALTAATDQLGPGAADVVTILDADNLVGPDFIARLNEAFDTGMVAVQAHRTAKNRDSDTAVLDAASEEINNSIFRRGHVALGLSSALIGSGMAFAYDWFRDNIRKCRTSGEDKELEALLLRQRIYIDYLDDLMVLDEKVQGEGAYYNQRRRWIAAQFYALGSALRDLPGRTAPGQLRLCGQAGAMVSAAANAAHRAGSAVGRRDDLPRPVGIGQMVGGLAAAALRDGHGPARRADRRQTRPRPAPGSRTGAAHRRKPLPPRRNQG